MNNAKEYAEKFILTVDHQGDVEEAYNDGYHQAEEDLTDKAQFSSGWDGFYYGQGYQQAKKDIALTWRDLEEIVEISNSLEKEWLSSTPWDGIKEHWFYQEVLKRFKNYKERNYEKERD